MATKYPHVWSLHRLYPLARMQLWLSRVQRSLLHITLDVPTDVLSALLERSAQWKSVTIRTHHSVQLNDTVSFMRHPFSQLQQLDCVTRWDTSAGHLVLSTERLIMMTASRLSAMVVNVLGLKHPVLELSNVAESLRGQYCTSCRPSSPRIFDTHNFPRCSLSSRYHACLSTLKAPAVLFPMPPTRFIARSHSPFPAVIASHRVVRVIRCRITAEGAGAMSHFITLSSGTSSTRQRHFRR
ncbi:hypothetical protein PAXRUDRAFT_559408 [Paxillus rubicundulus Ve08.2h10]|uniref:Uncharacterized protein n=1 Tax=Paxillus rubicundulus Ve08.2h10 TaxID=930991 RepID=A0A0D0DL09_9AGAM|nr:hypothetical protein PAXRUDRAFT_559408 [Paxillus rubicundulus Ve08.2h10]